MEGVAVATLVITAFSTVILLWATLRKWAKTKIHALREKGLRNAISAKREYCDVRGCRKFAFSIYKHEKSKDMVRKPKPYFSTLEWRGIESFFFVFCDEHLSDFMRSKVNEKADSINLKKSKIKRHSKYREEHKAEYESLGGISLASLRLYPHYIKCEKCRESSDAFFPSLNETDGEPYYRLLSVLLKPCERCEGEFVLCFYAHNEKTHWEINRAGERKAAR